MAFDFRLAEKYAMELARLSEADKKTGLNLSVADIGKALGIDSDESFRFARLLESSGWVKLEGKSFVRMTIDGFRAVEKLKRPAWQRWLDRHSYVKEAGKAVAIAVLTASVLYLLGFKK